MTIDSSLVLVDGGWWCLIVCVGFRWSGCLWVIVDYGWWSLVGLFDGLIVGALVDCNVRVIERIVQNLG